MKRVLLPFLVALVLFAASCSVAGSLDVSIEASQTMFEAGQSIDFKVILPEKDKFDAQAANYVLVTDADGAQVDYINLTSPEFEIYFGLSGKYSVTACVQGKKNYGFATVDLTVQFAGWQPEFSLKDQVVMKDKTLKANPTSIEGKNGSTATFYLQNLLDRQTVRNCDIVVKNSKGKVVFTKSKLDKAVGQFDYVHKASYGYGQMTLEVVLYFVDGDKCTVSDNFVVTDPNNPVKILFIASQDDKTYEDQIYVKGNVSITGVEGEIIEMWLERTCYYGREDGVFPLKEPVGDPSNYNDKSFYSLVDKEYQTHTEKYYAIRKKSDSSTSESTEESDSEGEEAEAKEGEEESSETEDSEGTDQEDSSDLNEQDKLLKYSAVDGDFEFLDPMPYYNYDGSVETTGFKWTYARFDREAWKAIKRKKHFDLEQAVSVQYKVCARAKINGQEKDLVESNVVVGRPYLSTPAMMQFCLWVKECALNRLWHMQIIRYAYSKSTAWLTSGQNVNGNISGNAFYSASISGGSGGVNNYSDWPGIRVYTNQNISVSGISLATNKQQTHSVGLTVVTNIWPQTKININVGVRDYTFQWGLWENSSNSTVSINRGVADETLGYDELKKFMPIYRPSSWNTINQEGYGYDSKDFGGHPNAWTNATFTRINFKINPIDGSPVEKGKWATSGEHWQVKYAVQ